MRLLQSLSQNRRGTAAVEFAMVAPIFLMLMLTFVGFGIYITAANGVQQIAADAARTAVAGLSSTERSKLATDYVTNSSMNYFMLDAKKLQVSVASDPNNANQFTVSIIYDASGLPIWSLYSFVLPQAQIKRFSTIRLGGI
jgi:Flp pilus assembly protein TadG